MSEENEIQDLIKRLELSERGRCLSPFLQVRQEDLGIVLQFLKSKDTRIKALEQQLEYYKGRVNVLGDIAKECEPVTERYSQPLETHKEKIDRLEQQLREAEGVIEAWHKVFGTTQLSHAIARLEADEARVKELEHFISVSVDCHLLEKFNQVVADKEKLESRLAQELERGKLKDAVVNVAKRFLIGHATIDALADTLTSLIESDGKEK